jgi:uncharacterized protein YcnI
VPALASGHATVSPVQPQGAALTAARTSYVLRVPNERPTLGTWKVRMEVPAAVQEAISLKKVPGWKGTLKKRDTGKKDADGNPIEAITSITWTAVTRGDEIDPHYFQEFPLRFQNPATAQKICFATLQYYRKNAKSRSGGEVVRWTGPDGSDTPASCVDVKEAAAS